jgi:hypothetical protein
MKILIGIPTCDVLDYTNDPNPRVDNFHVSGPNDRIQALRDTWLKDVSKVSDVTYRLFFGALDREPFDDEVMLDCPDDYLHLSHKTVAMCKWAVEHDYDWLFKTEDHCYVWPDRLVKDLETRKYKDYAGWVTFRNGVCGAGYWLSRRAFTIIANADPQSHWAEDKVTWNVLKAAGIHPEMAHLVRISYPVMWMDLNQVTPDLVACHAFKPDDMRKLYEKEKREERWRREKLEAERQDQRYNR